MNLPKTPFPLREDIAKFQARKQSLTTELYQWQSQNRVGEEFVLHDGPPYANGEAHIGHAVNKILKDFVVRYQIMRGKRVSYVPGWDCHGLPIELKATAKRENANVETIRAAATACADESIRSQRDAFMEWGIAADWDNYYTTKDKSYEARQIGVFFELFDKGYVYRSLKPVFWSPSSRTALAESEVEYVDDHCSPSVFVAFSVKELAPSARTLQKHSDLSLVIWTTTPWTLPANMAVAVNPNIMYCIASALGSSVGYIIAQERLNALAEKIGHPLEVHGLIPGHSLVGTKYTHPLDGRVLPVVSGGHVTTQSGTGLVHIAPGHGAEDYQIGKDCGLDILSIADEHGRFTEAVDASLRGLEVLGAGNFEIINALTRASVLVHKEEYRHKYPYDWRTKKPLIIRTLSGRQNSGSSE